MAAVSLHLLLKILDLLPSGVVISDAAQPGTPIVFANAAFCRMAGYASHEIVGRDALCLYGTETDRRAVSRLRQAIAAHKEIVLNVLNYRKDGTSFCSQLSVLPLRDEQGQAQYSLCVYIDVTEIMQLRERQQRSETIKASAAILSQEMLDILRRSHLLSAASQGNDGVFSGAPMPPEGMRASLTATVTALKNNLALLHTILATDSPEILEHVLRHGQDDTSRRFGT